MKWTPRQIPALTGRTAVVTGANSGIGWAVALELAHHGAKVVLACRNVTKGKQAAARIVVRHPEADVSVDELNLSSMDSVREFGEKWAGPLDLLVNNAAVMAPPKRAFTQNGFELQFGTNHLGHFAFTGLLLDRVLAAPGSRVVTVSSVGHRFARQGIRFDDLQSDRDYSRVGAYGQAKLANLLFTYELQRRLAGTQTIATAAHPGGSNTELARNLPAALRGLTAVIAPLMQDPDMGALPSLRAATDPSVLGGQYYGPDGFAEQRGYPKVVSSSTASHDVDAQRRLWKVSEELTKVNFPV